MSKLMISGTSGGDEVAFKDAFKWYKERLSLEYQKSLESGKPLLILIGELHGELYSHLIEGMIFYIANFNFGVKDTMIELDKYRYFSSRYLSFYRTKVFAMKDIEDITHEMGGALHLVDTAVNSFVLQWEMLRFEIYELFGSSVKPAQCITALSSEGIASRNKSIVRNMIQINKSAIGVFGAAHLEDLQRDVDLQNHYHVITVNAVRPDCVTWENQDGSTGFSLFDISQNFKSDIPTRILDKSLAVLERGYALDFLKKIAHEESIAKSVIEEDCPDLDEAYVGGASSSTINTSIPISEDKHIIDIRFHELFSNTAKDAEQLLIEMERDKREMFGPLCGWDYICSKRDKPEVGDIHRIDSTQKQKKSRHG